MKYFFFLGFLACNESNIESDIIVFDSDAYDYTCQDKPTQTEIMISLQSCDNQIQHVKTEITFNTGELKEYALNELYDCLWEDQLVILDEVCIQVTNVTVVGVLYE